MILLILVSFFIFHFRSNLYPQFILRFIQIRLNFKFDLTLFDFIQGKIISFNSYQNFYLDFP